MDLDDISSQKQVVSLIYEFLIIIEEGHRDNASVIYAALGVLLHACERAELPREYIKELFETGLEKYRTKNKERPWI